MQLCATAGSLAQQRAAARDYFFGRGHPQPERYLPGGSEEPGRERRFLAWFAFQHRLPEGDTPAMRLARSMMPPPIDKAAESVFAGARFITAAVTKLRHGQGFVLASGDERFPIEFPAMARRLQRDEVIVTGVLPIDGGWLMTPGWVSLSVMAGPNLVTELGGTTWDPVELERFLQGRTLDGADPEPVPPAPPRDDILAAAVRRLHREAKAAGMGALVRPTAAWREAAQWFITHNDLAGFVTWAYGEPFHTHCPPDQMNAWLALLTNVWNNTPQPDRGGKTATQLMRERAEAGGDGPQRHVTIRLERTPLGPTRRPRSRKPRKAT